MFRIYQILICHSGESGDSEPLPFSFCLLLLTRSNVVDLQMTKGISTATVFIMYSDGIKDPFFWNVFMSIQYADGKELSNWDMGWKMSRETVSRRYGQVMQH
jgi:hypothetical protein